VEAAAGEMVLEEAGTTIDLPAASEPVPANPPEPVQGHDASQEPPAGQSTIETDISAAAPEPMMIEMIPTHPPNEPDGMAAEQEMG
jgi:hypothetical protein